MVNEQQQEEQVKQQQQHEDQSMEAEAFFADEKELRANGTEVVVTDDAKDGSASDSTVDAVELKKEEKSSKKCSFCPAKKNLPVKKGCVIKACKKCCVSRNTDCPAHSDPMAKLPTEKAKKPVLKREFKETNFMYYEETVAIFCVRDFFASKKMSQGILNDQVRSLRVKGTYEGKQQSEKARVSDPVVKAKIASVFAKGAPFSPRYMALVE